MIYNTQIRYTFNQSLINHCLFYACIFLAFLSFLSRPSWATPITFDFTGTINVPILNSGNWVDPYYTTHPEWSGSLVNGSVTFRLDETFPSEFNNSTFSQYSATSSHPYAGWISFNVNQPDGKTLNIPGSAAPIPTPTAEGNDAYTHLAHLSDLIPDSGFYAQRSLNNFATYPQQHMSLALRAAGDGSEFLTSSANYNDVIIQPQFANFDNTGYVYYYTAPNEGYEYTFKIDSLHRVTNIPGPKSWTLILLAIGGFAIARLREVS